jgi:hypothetical protein
MVKVVMTSLMAVMEMTPSMVVMGMTPSMVVLVQINLSSTTYLKDLISSQTLILLRMTKSRFLNQDLALVPLVTSATTHQPVTCYSKALHSPTFKTPHLFPLSTSSLSPKTQL